MLVMAALPGHASYSCHSCHSVVEQGPREKMIMLIRGEPEYVDQVPRREAYEAAHPGVKITYFGPHWQAVMPEKGEEKKKLFVDDQTLAALFERLADAQEPLKVQFRFVLGLVLMRKRLVVYEGSRRDHDRDVWIVRMKGKEETLDLIDPKLTEQQVAEVSGQLGQILSDEM